MLDDPGTSPGSAATPLLDETLLEIKKQLRALEENTYRRTDPLWDDDDKTADVVGIADGAVKRHGKIIEVAFRHAFRRAGIEVHKVPARRFGREIDALIHVPGSRLLLAIDVKRGWSRHDSGKLRDMRAGLPEMKEASKAFAKFERWPVDLRDYRIEPWHYFHYKQDPKRGITSKMLLEYTDIDPAPYIEAATEVFKKGVAELLARKPRGWWDRRVMNEWPRGETKNES
jgi:hypothetical protein